ncbi:MAG: hybrid sensor histidine kinase/response regulator, partial [Flavobacteriales bacterium]|nr:hybrid sensor histidine kinase/response regulator [Flavobacteriales bacterium]
MTQIKPYFVAIFMLLTLSLSSQNSIEKDPEILQNTINYRITQSEYDIDKFNYFEAQKKLDEALKIAESIDDKKSIGLIYSKKGKLQLIIEELNEAIVSINKAIEVQRFEKDNINLGISYKTFGDIYKSKKNYKQAIDYYISAQTLFEQEEQNNYLAEVLLCEAETFIKLKNYQKARTINEQTLALAKRFNLLNIQSSALINHGKIYNVLGDNNKALSYANEGLLMAKNNNFGEILNEGYLVLSDITQSTGDYVLSNDYLRSHLKLSDSLSKIKRENLSPEKKIKFLINDQIENSKRQEQELKEANNKNELGTLISILSVALITILSLLTLSLYKNNNIRLKTNNMLHKKNAELIIAKEKAELASKTKANFLSTVTHELRTPLYAVTGLSNMLLEENPKPEQIQHLKSLKFSGDYLLTFINDILQINKIEANKVEIEPETFNLKKKITNIILALNNSANDNNTKLHLEYDKSLPENFIADQLKISQILINLIGNSIKFTKDGDIWIRVYKINEDNEFYNLRFEVEDNGIGISQEKQENMFESFSQG